MQEVVQKSVFLSLRSINECKGENSSKQLASHEGEQRNQDRQNRKSKACYKNKQKKVLRGERRLLGYEKKYVLYNRIYVGS